MKILSKGDTIYAPSAEWSAIPKPCPVCAGTTRVLLKALGAPDEQGTEMRCEYCRFAERDRLQRGHVVEDWDWKAVVRPIVIEGVEINDRPGKKEVKYLYNCTSCSWNSVRHEDVYTDRDEAMKAAETSRRNAKNPNDRTIKDQSHTVGYCKLQIKNAEAEATRWRNHMHGLTP